MGVVYSTREVRINLLPQPGNHEAAALAVMERVSALGGLVLTMVHGSVPEGRSNLRSDLDVLALYSFSEAFEEPGVINVIKAELEAIEHNTNVKIEANLWPANEHPTARVERMYDLLFSRHLADAMSDSRWCLGQPDQAILDVANTPLTHEHLRRVVLNYMTYKHAGFVRAPRQYDESDAALKAMQRALEFPKAAKRKIDQLMCAIDGSDNFFYDALELSEEGEELMGSLEVLRELDAAYTSMLTGIITRNTIDGRTLGDYTDWLHQTYPRTMHLGIVAASGFTSFVCSNFKQ